MPLASLLPLPRAVFYDANGAPLAGGYVYTYVPGGVTPKLTWQDSGETTPNTNPIVLDANGSCLMYGDGQYQITVTDSLGNSVPAYSGLSINPAVASGGNLIVTGDLTVDGDTALGGDLTVAGDETVTGTLTVSGRALAAFLRGFISGLITSRSSATVLGVSAGVATDSTNAVSIFLGAFTKSTAGTWVAGTGANGMGQGLAIANSTWYHVFVIIVSGVEDMYFDTSITAANKPALTTAFRRIGSFKTNGSAQIIDFTQVGDEFLWSVAVQDVAATGGSALGTTATSYALTVPLGVKVMANMRVIAQLPNNGDTVLVQSPDETTQVANTPSGNAQFTAQAGLSGAGYLEIRTNTSRQIKAVASSASTTLYVVTYGWIDTRGQYD
tara:strand:- start:11312 stop:12463 length:1152 start_codon:yes stop_codon:yes gene_type:complete